MVLFIPIDFSIEFWNCTFPLAQKFLKFLGWWRTSQKQSKKEEATGDLTGGIGKERRVGFKKEGKVRKRRQNGRA